MKICKLAVLSSMAGSNLPVPRQWRSGVAAGSSKGEDAIVTE